MKTSPIVQILMVVIPVAMMVWGQQDPPASQKVIRDPAEYNAYIAALNAQNPTAKAAVMEAFVNQYPNSVVKVDALEQAMAAYQQVGSAAKVLEIARRILQLNPNSIRPLAIVTAINRSIATQGGSTAAGALQEGCSSAQMGLQQLPNWQKPEGLSDADFEKVRNQMANIFNGAVGFCELQAKDYASARDHYLKAVGADPNNMQDIYQLGITDLEKQPLDINGFWYLAKAYNLAATNPRAQQSIASYGKAKYHNYHGGDDGWDQLLAQAGSQTAPPVNFSIRSAATPCDLAVQVVQQNDPRTLSFADKEFVLSRANCSPANKNAADKVWKSIQDMEKGGKARLKIPAKVIASTTDSLDAAISDDSQSANKADVHIVLERSVVPAPSPGAAVSVVGVITDYTASPFMFIMQHAQLVVLDTTQPLSSSIQVIQEKQRNLETELPLSPEQQSALVAEEKTAETAEQSGQHREALRQYLTALQGLPKSVPSDVDQDLRQRIIRLVLTLNPLPAIPEEARRHAVFADTAFDLAKQDPSQLSKALGEWQEVLRIAPWWASAYFNAGLIAEKLQRYSEAMRYLKLYLLAAPSAADADAVQQKIYKFEYLAQQQDAR